MTLLAVIARSAPVLLVLLLTGGCGDPAGTGPGAGDRASLAGLPEAPAVDTSEMLPAVREQVEAAWAAAVAASAEPAPNGHYAMLLQAYGLNEAADGAYARARAIDPDNADWPYL